MDGVTGGAVRANQAKAGEGFHRLIAKRRFLSTGVGQSHKRSGRSTKSRIAPSLKPIDKYEVSIRQEKAAWTLLE